jgi:Na+-transporting NADH:ubiquinone oxidoreductase subunit C
MNRNNLLYTVIFTFAASFFFVFFLSLADSLTAEKTAANERISFYSAFLRSAGIDFTDKNETKDLFTRYFPESGDFPFRETIRASVDGKDMLLRLFSGSGLWGTITGVIAVSPDLRTIRGLEIITHNETPGLGGRIDEQWFKDQFKGEAISLQAGSGSGSAGGIRVRKGAGGMDSNPDNSEVEGITGASLTSKSVETIVNNVIAELAGEEGVK